MAGMLTYMAVTVFSAVGFLRRYFYGEVAELSQQGVLAGGGVKTLISVVAKEAPRHLVATALVLIWTTR